MCSGLSFELGRAEEDYVYGLRDGPSVCAHVYEGEQGGGRTVFVLHWPSVIIIIKIRHVVERLG